MWSCVFTGEKKEEGLRSTACSNGTTMGRGCQERKRNTHTRARAHTHAHTQRMGVDEGTWKDDFEFVFIHLS